MRLRVPLASPCFQPPLHQLSAVQEPFKHFSTASYASYTSAQPLGSAELLPLKNLVARFLGLTLLALPAVLFWCVAVSPFFDRSIGPLLTPRWRHMDPADKEDLWFLVLTMCWGLTLLALTATALIRGSPRQKLVPVVCNAATAAFFVPPLAIAIVL
jgi:hypothetical protein